jgi:hypothetical protein
VLVAAIDLMVLRSCALQLLLHIPLIFCSLMITNALRNCIGIPCSAPEVSNQSNINMGFIPLLQKLAQKGSKTAVVFKAEETEPRYSLQMRIAKDGFSIMKSNK